MGRTLLHELSPHFLVLLFEQRLNLARLLHQLLFLNGNGGISRKDVLQLPLALELVAVA